MSELTPQQEAVEAAEVTPQQEAVEAAEVKLRAMASQMRAVSANGTSAVFSAIGDIASKLELGLAEFLAADSAEEQLEIFTQLEEGRAQWVQELDVMQTSIQDAGQSEAPTEAPSERDAEVEDFHDAEEACATSADPFDAAWSTYLAQAKAMPVATSAAVRAPVNIPKKSVIQDPPLALACTPEEMTKHVAKYLQDGEEEGYLVTLKLAVDKVKADSSFEDIHEDAAKFLEHMQEAAKVVLTEPPEMEVSRAAMRNATDAKRHASNIRKFDIYKRRDKSKLADEHVDLLQAATVGVPLAGYLRKRSQDAILDSVTAMVAAEVGSP